MKNNLLTEDEKNMILNMLNKLDLENNIDKVDELYDYFVEYFENLECVINRYSAE